MPNDTVSSQPVADTAGGKDGLDRALEAALASANVEEDDYVPESTPVEKIEPVEQAAEPATEGEPAAETETTDAKAPAGLDAPAHWDAKRREAFGRLPPSGQKILLDMSKGMEAEHTKRSTELAETARLGQSIRSLISDEHRAQMQRSGMDEAGGIRFLLQANDFYTRDARGYLRWVAQQARIDPRSAFPELAGGQPQQQPQGQQPQGQQPQQAPSRDFYSALQPLVQTVQGLVQERQTERATTAEDATAAFRGAKNPDGTPVYPFVGQVEEAMIEWLGQPSVQKIRAFPERLKRAYELAVYDNVELRQQQETAARAREATAKQKANDLAKAKKARAPIRSQPTTPVNVKSRGLDAALDAAFDEVGVSR